MSGRNTRRMNRTDLTRLLVAALPPDAAVVAGIGNTNFDLWGVGRRPQNFYMLGSMGLACPIALGVALAQPGRPVIAIEGDGSLLMQLGSLATIAMAGPRNLTVVVMDNAIYQITGGQKTASSAGADFAALARGAGIARAAWAADESDFSRMITRALVEDGPNLIAAAIDDKPATAQTERDPARIRDRFMRGLGVRPAE